MAGFQRLRLGRDRGGLKQIANASGGAISRFFFCKLQGQVRCNLNARQVQGKCKADANANRVQVQARAGAWVCRIAAALFCRSLPFLIYTRVKAYFLAFFGIFQYFELFIISIQYVHKVFINGLYNGVNHGNAPPVKGYGRKRKWKEN